MEAIINKTRYKTADSTLLHEWIDPTVYATEPRTRKKEALYRTEKGNYFIAGSGDFRGEWIEPKTSEGIEKWLHTHGGEALAKQLFPSPEVVDA
ncbi:MAG: hypothetical protein HQK89_02230 [Nitrospirae bacterium]|nr:hypothetical protein [Nitrospirota bacterium]